MDRPPYYLVRLNPTPRSIAARANRKENYHWEYRASCPNTRCEITFLQEGSLSEMREDGEHTYEQGTVLTFVENRFFSMYSKDPVYQEFYLSFHAALPPEPIPEERVAAWFSTANEAILPEHITDPAVCRQLAGIIKPVVGIAESDQAVRELKLRTAMYECLALVTEYAVLQARQRLARLEKQRSRCTIKAISYIRDHLAEKMAVEDVAKAAGVKYDLLKKEFRRDMNMSLVEYINHTRIRQVENLITVRGMKLEEAGAQVGISDPDYLSRLFRQYTGVTVREYRQAYAERQELSGATLAHGVWQAEETP